MGDWMNDMNNWRQRWSLQNVSMPSGPPSASVCLQAALQTPVLAKKRTPWLSEMESNEDEVASTSVIQARLWSPKIPARLGMRCLTLQYAFHMGAASDDVSVDTASSASLSLMQRQEGCLLASKFIPFVFNFTHRLPSSSLSFRANLNCTFETDSCEWTNDPNNWLASWQTSSARRAHSQQKIHSSPELCLKPTLHPPSSASSPPPDFTGRLYSPLLRGSDRVGCLKFTYLVVAAANADRKRTARGSGLPIISVLRPTEQRSRSRRPPRIDCNFEDVSFAGGLCGWNIDPRDVGAAWHLDSSSKETWSTLACVEPTLYHSETEDFEDRFESFDAASQGSSPRTFSARLWSGQVGLQSSAGPALRPQCLRLVYRFAPLSRLPSTGEAAEEAACFSHLLRVSSYLLLVLRADQQLRPLPTAITGGSGGGGSGTMGVIDCSFESGNFCGWKDDPRDSGAAWSIVDLSSDSEQSGHALCLRPASGAISEDFDDPFEDIPRATKSELSARLWSPRVRMGVAPLMCLKLAYSTRPSMNISARLSLMRHSSGHSAVRTYLDSHGRVVSSADCNFDGDGLCRWMPDPRDGGGRWSLETPAGSQTDSRVVCLRPGRRSDSQADPFSLLDEEEEEGNAIDSGSSSSSSSRNLSARLWSSKIRTLDGTPVQCLKLAYQIVLGEPSSVEELPVISGPPNLAMLRHSSG
nr:unnamed protein product [Spirometra erinaceieuropaei]